MSEVLTNGIKVPDKGSRAWYDDMRGDLVKLDALIGSASSVTVNPMLTSGIEIASITVNGTSYSLYQQDGDIAVNIKPVTSNEELPVLLSKSTEENTDTVDMSVGVTVNPSTNAITATTFNGALNGNATSATNATNDANGNVISTTYAKVNNLALVATSGAYSDLTGKPSIPTVNDAVLTIQQNGANVKTFSANASANVTANITVPTKVSELTNDSGFLNNTLINNTTKGSLGYTSIAEGGTNLPTMSTLAYWNGAYSNTRSNLAYCSIGAFGDIVTHSTSEFLTEHQTIVLAFCSSAVNNGSSVAGTSLKVANGGTGGSFTATSETLTGTYRALNTVVANGVGMFVKIA